VHERRLARARGAHHGDEVAGLQRDGHSAERVDGGVAAAVTPGDVTGSGDRDGVVGPEAVAGRLGMANVDMRVLLGSGG
jgi:hypothetical protein